MRLQPYSIVVATKDRETFLSNFFDSVVELTTKPTEVVVCSSGRDITSIIQQYESVLNIVHVVSDVASQVYQKKLAILNLTKEVEWVAFFDDDVILNADSIDEAFNTLENDECKDLIAGIGFSIENIDLMQTGILGKIHRNKLGQVLKSGHNVAYLSSKFPIYTQWLNGASMWKYSALGKYDNELEGLKRSLGEDLIFSYEVSKNHKLIYCPNAKILFQDPLSQYVDLRGKELKLYFFVMIYFVLRNKELSIFRFYIFQMTRFLSGLFINSFSNQLTLREILDFFSIYIRSMRLIFTRNRTEYINKQLAL